MLVAITTTAASAAPTALPTSLPTAKQTARVCLDLDLGIWRICRTTFISSMVEEIRAFDRTLALELERRDRLHDADRRSWERQTAIKLEAETKKGRLLADANAKQARRNLWIGLGVGLGAGLLVGVLVGVLVVRR